MKGIQTMDTPTRLDLQRAIVVQMYEARESLMIAESSAADEACVAAETALRDATALAQASIALLASDAMITGAPPQNEWQVHDDVKRIEVLLRRTEAAIGAAMGHVRRFKAYETKGLSTKLEQDVRAKLKTIWRKAAEDAKKDAHRALVLICERFPEAYRRDPMEDK